MAAFKFRKMTSKFVGQMTLSHTQTHIHTYTHTYIYIYIYIYTQTQMCVIM